MPELLKREQIDTERWDNLVLNSPFFKHYYLSRYLDAAAEDWCALVEADYEWVWPLPFKVILIKKVYQPLLCQQLGPIGLVKLTNAEIRSALSAVEGFFNSWDVKFNECYDSLPTENIVKHRNITLNLDQSYSLIASNYKRNARVGLKKFEACAGSIERDLKFDKWSIDTFRSTKRAGELKVLDDDFYSRVKQIYCAFESTGSAYILSAKVLECIVGQVLVLEAGKRLLILFTALTEEGRSCGAMPAILDHLIAMYAGNAGYILDFEGSNDDKVARFYKSFGGQEHVYLQAHKTSLLERLKHYIKNG
jgi:hypothetical protein